MSTARPYARIAITLPPEDLAAADRLAKAQDRSRSWVMAEALRHYVAAHGPVAGPTPYEPGLGVSRTRQLLRDLALTPEERVRAAEETLALHGLVRESRPAASRFFDHYDDFLDWKRDRDVAP